MTSPSYWNEAKTYLSKRDKTLKSIINNYEGETLTLRGDAFFTLARSIAGQQISVKAADSVWRKFEGVVGKVTPEIIAATDAATLRTAGLSASKVVYMHALANHFLENKKLIKRWPELDDDAIIAELTSIKGIGRWTAEMFLIFGLGRPDVFPVADIGLQKAILKHYPLHKISSSPHPNPPPQTGEGIKKLSTAELKAFGEQWQPYRTVATWYLWRSLDPVPVEY